MRVGLFVNAENRVSNFLDQLAPAPRSGIDRLGDLQSRMRGDHRIFFASHQHSACVGCGEHGVARHQMTIAHARQTMAGMHHRDAG